MNIDKYIEGLDRKFVSDYISTKDFNNLLRIVEAQGKVVEAFRESRSVIKAFAHTLNNDLPEI